MKLLKSLLASFIVLIIIYVSTLTVVFMLPKDSIQSNAIKNIGMLVHEKDDAYIFKRDSGIIHGIGGRIDALTDAVMLTRNVSYNTLNNDKANAIQSFFRFPHNFSDDIYDNPLKNAMCMNGYGRYWHGYEVFLRPLLVFTDYVHIRQFNTIIFYTCFLWVVYILYKRLDIYIAGVFLLGMCFCKFPLIPLSMQFMNLFMLMLLSLIGVNYWLNSKMEKQIINGHYNQLYIICFIIGSLTAFLDLLTTPLLPIGMALFYIIVLFHQKYKYEFSWRFLISGLAIWTLGYLGTWSAKWILCYIVLDKNILGEVIDSIVLRMNGITVDDGGVKLSTTRAISLAVNLTLLAAPFDVANISKFVVLMVMGIFLLSHFYPSKEKKYTLQLLMLGLVPIIWYLLIVNHSFIHCWYTYRNLLFTVMCVGVYLKEKVDWQAFCQKIKLR